MARNAVIDTATGFVKRWGECDFTQDGSFDVATETQVVLRPGAIPVRGVLQRYNKVAAGAFVEMTAPEKTAADAAFLAQRGARGGAAPVLELTVPTTAVLRPPTRDGLVVGVQDVGAGNPGIAVSVGGSWAIFQADSVI